jgi:UDP-glucose 4-epimerase
MNKKIVAVLGGSGFLGSHIVDQLDKEGYSVRILDIKACDFHKDKHEIFIADILDRDALHECIKGCDYVYNFAGIADIKEASNNPIATIEKNTLGATYAMQESVDSKVKKFLYASSMYVYSSYGSFYRSSKQCAEEIISSYSEEYGIEYVMLRYGTLYGPRSQRWNSMRKYIYQLMSTGVVDYIGTGEEIREYIHVKDAACLSVKVLNNNYVNCGLNITGSQVMHSIEMLKMIGEILNKDIKINLINDDPDHNHYVTTPYRYTPKPALKISPSEFVDIGHGILEMIEEMDKERKNL